MARTVRKTAAPAAKLPAAQKAAPATRKPAAKRAAPAKKAAPARKGTAAVKKVVKVGGVTVGVVKKKARLTPAEKAANKKTYRATKAKTSAAAVAIASPVRRASPSRATWTCTTSCSSRPAPTRSGTG